MPTVPSYPVNSSMHCWNVYKSHDVVYHWTTLCFRYVEIELGPHGHHIVLFLDGVRNAVAKLLPIQYDAVIGESRLSVFWSWRVSSLTPMEVSTWSPAFVNFIDVTRLSILNVLVTKFLTNATHVQWQLFGLV